MMYILRITPRQGIVRILRAITLLSIAWASFQVAFAQPQLDTAGRFQPLNPAKPLPDTSAGGFSQVFFSDSLHGYLAGATPNSASFGTTDGGATWNLLAASVPIPHTIYPSGFGVAPSGYIMTGGAWRPIPFDRTSPSLAAFGAITSAAAVSPSRIIATSDYTVSRFDSSDQRMIYRSVTRLLITTDGGATWAHADSIAFNDPTDGDQPLVMRQTSIGTLPRPDTVPYAKVGWAGVLTTPDTSSFYLISYATWSGPAAGWMTRAEYYLGKVDLATMQATWTPLPFWVDDDPNQFLPEDYAMTWVNPNLVVSYTPLVTSVPKRYQLMRSTDGGATWDTINTPPWLAFRTARFFSANEIVAANGSTTDGGATWTPRSNPFWGHAVDTMLARRTGFASVTRSRQVLVSGNLLASSGDGGGSWTRNHSWGVPGAIVARDRHVVIGWSMRAITASDNAGQEWNDAGVSAADIPERLHRVFTMAYVKPAPATDEILGLASFVSDSGDYIACIRSTDGGRSWREERHPSDFELSGFRIDDLAPSIMFVPSSSGSGMRAIIGGLSRMWISDDGGHGWSAKQGRLLTRTCMVDSDHGFGAYFDRDAAVNTTSDGGATWSGNFISYFARPYSADVVAPGHYAILCDVSDLRSDDSGRTWREAYHFDPSSRPGNGIIHRLDSSRIYWLGNKYWYYSSNGGESLQAIHASTARYDDAISARDANYIYLAGPNNAIARWRLGNEPASGVKEGTRGDERMVMIENPVRDGVARLRCRLDRAANVAVEIVDMLGRTVASFPGHTAEAGEQMLDIDVAGLAGGDYLMVTTIDTERRALLLRIAR